MNGELLEGTAMNRHGIQIWRAEIAVGVLALLVCLAWTGLASGGEKRSRERESVNISDRPSGGKSQPPGKKPGGGNQKAPAKGEVIHITDENVAAAVRKGVSAVYFWAEWCGPCRIQGPIMDTVAKKYAGKVKILKMNIDHEKKTAEKFQVSQIPTMILFRNGRPAVKLIGLIREEEFDEEIEELMKRPPPKEKPKAPGRK